MAEESRLAIVRLDARTIIRYPDKLETALLHLNVNFAGSGVHGIFDQLLDHRSWALDHLPGSNLVGDMLVQHNDMSHRYSPLPANFDLDLLFTTDQLFSLCYCSYYKFLAFIFKSLISCIA
ncbi:hypothetical protein D3C77_378030 [compost metagenome]